MSEQAPRSHEQHEDLTLSPEQQAPPTAERGEKQRRAEEDPAKKLQEARAEVAEVEKSVDHKNPLEELKTEEKEAEPAAPGFVDEELKGITLRRELQQLRRKESAPQRVLSRVVHQPAVRVVSEAAGKTVSRPSGLLGGGIVALIGTSGYLYYAKHMGFQYNYFVFTALFIGGFALGVVLELLFWLLTAPKRRNHAHR